ncbi:MAG: molybdenum cofactor biosynthesis protein MoaB [Desulfobacterales bacterium]|jgi:molybdenum cofactor biosynthesis protein B|nr:molybdenum cofactor biosynthesis protein MoaB [Desulfobacterales bacterium]
MGTAEHKRATPKKVTLAVHSLSSTRTLADDVAGHWIRQQAEALGHEVVCHRVVADDAAAITLAVREIVENNAPDILLMTGGTGLAPRDVTIEAVEPMFTKTLSAFGPLFAQLSLQEIGSAAIMSRATAGVIGATVVFCMPGSLNACKLACTRLIFPELGHLAKHVKGA